MFTFADHVTPYPCTNVEANEVEAVVIVARITILSKLPLKYDKKKHNKVSNGQLLTQFLNCTVRKTLRKRLIQLCFFFIFSSTIQCKDCNFY